MSTERRENMELLMANQKRVSAGPQGPQEPSEPAAPPDGGYMAYSVLAASFLTNGLIFGVINSYSIIHSEFSKQAGVVDPVSALTGSLVIGITFAMSPVSGLLTGFFGIRLTTVLGGFISALGLFLSSFATENKYVLCFTYGIIYGLGASFAYTPSLAILGHYFKKYLGIANGLASLGSSVFSVIVQEIMEPLIKSIGVPWLFRCMSLTGVCIVLCGLMFKPIPSLVIGKSVKSKQSFLDKFKEIGFVELWKLRSYRFWALCMPIALFGYFVPYIHIIDLIKEHNIPEEYHTRPLQVLLILSFIGRLFFGFLADRQCINRILMQQIAFYLIGTLTIILPFIAGNVALILVIMAGIGMCEGGFISLIGPIGVELAGTKYAGPAIGCMLGLAALPVTVGPYIASFIKRGTGNFTLPFILAGLSPIIGATAMFTIHYARRTRTSEPQSNGHALTIQDDAFDNSTLPLHRVNGHTN